MGYINGGGIKLPPMGKDRGDIYVRQHVPPPTDNGEGATVGLAIDCDEAKLLARDFFLEFAINATSNPPFTLFLPLLVATFFFNPFGCTT